ncbi:peptidoglycan-binding domain-containing protein [Streptomyces cinnamoneus]|uniref:peptidoglycan-binding domain-containing protein n=1 Tax=Streptomyces cinnamoneus TaxID=53446 RepID=UPI0034162902
MNVRKRIALATATVALGTGLAVAPAAGAFATTGSTATVQKAAASCGYYNGNALTKAGQTGAAARERIKEVQCLINVNTSYPKWLDVDGSFGQETYKAVVKVQQKARISDDGEVGRDTWAKLRAGVRW